MKQINILAFFFALTLILGGCEDTNENLVGSRGMSVMPEISAINPAFFTSDIANSYIAFTVALPEGETVDAAEIQVMYKGKTSVLKPIKSFPANITVPASEVVKSLGISENDVAIGDSFTIYVVTTTNGVTSRSPAALVVNVTCEFDTNLTTGSYHVVSSDWQVEGDVTVTADQANPFKLNIIGLQEMEGLVNNGNNLVLTIDPFSFKMSGSKTILAADLLPWKLSYTNYYYDPIGGLYNSCDGSFTMQVKIGIDQGSYGTFNFKFTRNADN